MKVAYKYNMAVRLTAEKSSEMSSIRYEMKEYNHRISRIINNILFRGMSVDNNNN